MKRSEAYIGVLIDDLITKGTEEPYRMFTSRAEYRLLLRQDNADIRLTKIGHDIGLASLSALKKVELKENSTELLLKFLNKQSVSPEEINNILSEKGSANIKQKVKIKSVLARPHVSMKDIMTLDSVRDFIEKKKINDDAVIQAEIKIKYSGYINKENESVRKMSRFENIKIPDEFDYEKLHSISTEGKEKLKLISPKTIGQASRISGVSASDINILLIYIGR